MMEERAVSGVVWTLLSQSGTKVLLLLTTLLLTTMLEPSDFGVVALATVVLVALGLFRDLGLSSALVVRREHGPEVHGTFLTLMVLVGTGIAVLVCALSPVAAAFFGEPRLTPVLLVLSSTVLLGAVTAFYDALLQRELEFRRRFVAQTAFAVSYAVSALGTAAAGAGVWSLVIAQVAALVVQALVLVASCPLRVGPTFSRSVARRAVLQGRGFFLQGALAFVELNAATFATGRFLGASATGVWSISYRLAELPYQGVTEPVARVTFPAFRRMEDRGEDVRAAYLATLRLVAVVTVPMGVLLSACAGPFSSVFLSGGRWAAAAGVLSLMGLWAALRNISATAAWLLNSLDASGLVARVTLVPITVLLPGLVLAAGLGGLREVALVVLGAQLVSVACLVVAVDRWGGIPLLGQWRAVRPVFLAAAVTWGVAWGAGELTGPRWGAPAALAVGLAAGLAFYVAGLELAERGLLRTCARQIGRTIGRGTRVADEAEGGRDVDRGAASW